MIQQQKKMKTTNKQQMTCITWLVLISKQHFQLLQETFQTAVITANIVLTMINEFCFKTAYSNCECNCAEVTSSEGECLWSFFRMCN